jgi:FAD synthetase
MRKVMVFGVFDGLHDGHRSFLEQAKELGDWLIAIVCHDHVVHELKKKQPDMPFEERLDHLKRVDHVDEAMAGDPELGSWSVLKKFHPEVIALGYDQQALKKDLELHMEEFPWGPEIVMLEAYKPEEMHTSIRKGRK